MRRRATWLLLGVALLIVGLVFLTQLPAPSGASDVPSAPSSSLTPTPTPTVRSATLRGGVAGTSIAKGTEPAERAATMSRALFATSPVVVLAPDDDVVAQVRAASISAVLGAPLLLTGTDDAATTTEISRLGARDAIVVGSALPGTSLGGARLVAAPLSDAALGRFLGFTEPGPSIATVASGDEVAAVSELRPGGRTILAADPPPADATPPPADATATTPPDPRPTATADGQTPTPTPTPSITAPSGATEEVLERTVPPAPALDTLVLTDGDQTTLAAVATARAAGARVVHVPGGDPRASSTTVKAISASDEARVVAVGSDFASADDLAWKVATAATGVELPGGGQVLFPGRQLVALYGNPGTPALGLLGEQDLPASIARAKEYAAQYQALTATTVVPGFEIIATIAARDAGPDGDYSDETPAETLLPWVRAAREAGVYVVLDLQPGRTDFLTQAKRYESLLVEPNVGLALDAEWRLAPDQVHLRQIGSVGIDEVNSVVTWLADLTREQALPQKLFVLHQFASRMIVDRERLDMSRDELAMMVHVDGQGSQPAKAGTWAALRNGAPGGLRWGWKNFIDEDVPMLTPEQTLQVVPTPDLVTYQ